jgi:hypothetical protein
MGDRAREVLEAALALPKDERADLAEQLLTSIKDEVADADMFSAAEPDPEIEKAWATEITRRAECARRGETVGIPGSVVEAEARRILALGD